MKKAISIIISVVMLISVCAVSSITAFAVPSPGPVDRIEVQVNGSTSSDVKVQQDAQLSNQLTFTYDGDGTLIGWDFPGMTENMDYRIVSQAGNQIVISVINDDFTGKVIVNAIVEQDTTTTTTTDSSETTTKKDNDTGSKSPSTGVVATTGLAIAGAGVALLAVMKKKNNAE